MKIEILIGEIVSVVLIAIGLYFIVLGIDLLQPGRYAVVAGVASLASGLLIIGSSVTLLRTILISLTAEKKESI
ncbi:MAG TPA: hypothetical protein EYH44_05180 [Thermoprotei archaeon]|nr:hypothetical protein [Thermoprotei archaeon]